MDSRVDSTPTTRSVLHQANSNGKQSYENITESTVLKNVVAFVEVRTTDEDHSDVFAHYLQLLGATISKYLNRKVTHVVFQNGRKSTYNKAISYGVHMVSVLWVDACLRNETVADEKDFSASIPEEFTSPFYCGKVPRFRSVFPKCTEFDPAKSLERKQKRREHYRINREVQKFLKEAKTNVKRSEKSLQDDESATPPVSTSERILIETPISPTIDLQKKLDEIPTVDWNFDNTEIISSQDSTSNWDIPLAQRILNKSLSNSTPATETPDSEHPSKRRKLFAQTDDKLEFTPQLRSTFRENNVQRRLLSSSSSDSMSVNEESTLNSSTTDEFRVVDKSLEDFDLSKMTIETKKLKSTKQKLEKRFDELMKSSECESEVEGNGGTKPGPRRLSRKRLNDENFSSPTRNFVSRSPSIVLTSMHVSEQEAAAAVVSQLGHYRIVFNVDDTTSHVVCGSPRRTLNVLYAVVRGCWLLTPEWIFRSLEEGSWLAEENFEIADFCPGIRESRKLTLVMSPSERVRNGVFKETGQIYIGDNVQPNKKDLKQLILLSGGKVTNRRSNADILVGENLNSDVTNVSEKWILDCISTFTLLPTKDYLLKG